MSGTQPTRTQTPTLDKKYEIYLASNGETAATDPNPLNLFDTLNNENKAWLRIAHACLADATALRKTEQRLAYEKRLL